MDRAQITAYVTGASETPSLPPLDPMAIVGHLLLDLEENYKDIPLSTRATIIATAAILVKHHMQTAASAAAADEIISALRRRR